MTRWRKLRLILPWVALTAVLTLGATTVYTDMTTFPLGNAISPNAIDASQAAGSDACAKISAAATALQAVAPGGGTVDARGFGAGVFACANSPYNGWPADPFYATLKFGCGQVWRVPTTIVVPTRNFMEGCGPYGGIAGIDNGNGGTVIEAATTFPNFTGTITSIGIGAPPNINITNTFTAGQPVQFQTTGALPTGLLPNQIYYVSATGLTGAHFGVATTIGGTAITTSGTSTGTQTVTSSQPLIALGAMDSATDTFNIIVKNFTLHCVDSGAGTHAGSIGLMNVSSQQQTEVDRFTIRGCWTGLLVAGHGDDNNIYRNIRAEDQGLPNTAGGVFTCLQVGMNNSITIEKNKIADFDQINCQNFSVPTPALVQLNSFNYSVRHVYLEYQVTQSNVASYLCIGCMAGGASYGVGYINIDDVQCGGTPNTGVEIDCVKINSITGSGMVNGPITITNFGFGGQAGNAFWKIINDGQPNGCSALANTESGAIGFYSRGGSSNGTNNTVLTTSGGSCKSSISSLTMPSAPTASSGGTVNNLCIDGNNVVYRKATTC